MPASDAFDDDDDDRPRRRRRDEDDDDPPRRRRRQFDDAEDDYLDDIMHTPEGLKWWYLRAIGQIAERANVTTCNIEGLTWGEVDFPADLERVTKLVEDWPA